jgi:cytochrome oxidase Cu insertion factor (SCO1/SenC/PrrC family)
LVRAKVVCGLLVNIANPHPEEQMADSLPEIAAPAPDFSLPDQSGNTVSLNDFKGKQSVVLFFYPKADTPG